MFAIGFNYYCLSALKKKNLIFLEKGWCTATSQKPEKKNLLGVTQQLLNTVSRGGSFLQVMSGYGKGGKGLGKGGAKRHRKILRDNIEGVTNPAIRRIARRGGVKRASKLTYGETRGIVKVFLENVVRDAVTYTEHAKRKTVVPFDVVAALKRQGRTLYGFGEYRSHQAPTGVMKARAPTLVAAHKTADKDDTAAKAAEAATRKALEDAKAQAAALEAARKQRAATMIQKVVRGGVVRLKNKKKAEAEKAAATMIQKIVRGGVVRLKTKKLKAAKAAEAAAAAASAPSTPKKKSAGRPKGSAQKAAKKTGSSSSTSSSSSKAKKRTTRGAEAKKKQEKQRQTRSKGSKGK